MLLGSGSADGESLTGADSEDEVAGEAEAEIVALTVGDWVISGLVLTSGEELISSGGVSSPSTAELSVETVTELLEVFDGAGCEVPSWITLPVPVSQIRPFESVAMPSVIVPQDK